MRSEGGIAGEGIVVGVPKYSHWISNASSGL